MEREIKFRAYNTSTGQMLPAIDIKTIYSISMGSSENLIWLQFTGLKDKNGKEIFEGDIVIPTKFKDKPNIVKYISHGFYRHKKHGDKEYINPMGSCEVEIIGNTYENPELLNKL